MSPGGPPIDRLAAIARAAESANPDDVKSAVAEAAKSVGSDAVAVAALADALTPLFPMFADSIASEVSPARVEAFADAGKPAVAAAVIERWMATARWAPITELSTLLARRPLGHPTPDAGVLLAMARASAFVDPAAADRYLEQAREGAHSPGAMPSPEAIEEARAVILAVDDIPMGEGAARRALARVAAERDWHPDSWGRDHGALVALVRKRASSASDRFRGPLMTFMTKIAPTEVKRFAKGAKGGGGAAAWVSRVPRPESPGPGSISSGPDANFDRPAILKAFAQEVAGKREGARLRASLPKTKSDIANSGVTRHPRVVRSGVGGILSSNWWFPIFIGILGIILAIARLFR